jgi:hypothetical protein
MSSDSPHPVTASIKVTVDVVRHKRIETFGRTIAPGVQPLHDLVDYFEGQVGTVLGVRDENGKTLYRSAVNPWEAGVQ